MSQLSVQSHKSVVRGVVSNLSQQTEVPINVFKERYVPKMAKDSSRGKSNLTHSDVAAIELTGLPYTEPEVISVRGIIKSKAANASKGGQYYELMDDSLWSTTDHEELDTRLFAAVRLVVEYDGPAGKHIHDKENRRASLIGLIEKVAKSRQNQKALESLTVLKKAGGNP
jgi:hypothetical protein